MKCPLPCGVNMMFAIVSGPSAVRCFRTCYLAYVLYIGQFPENLTPFSKKLIFSSKVSQGGITHKEIKQIHDHNAFFIIGRR